MPFVRLTLFMKWTWGESTDTEKLQTKEDRTDLSRQVTKGFWYEVKSSSIVFKKWSQEVANKLNK